MNPRRLLPILVPLSLAACSAGADQESAAELSAADTTQGCPGTDWTWADSWAGLKGYFARSYLTGQATLGEMTSLWVLDDPGSGLRASVRYSRTTGHAGVENGTLHTLASNPAVGAHDTFDDPAGRLRDVYSGKIARDPISNKIVRLCVIKETGAPGETHRPFLMTRVGL